MTLRGFSLKPFRGEESGHDIKISGSIGRRSNLLTLRCSLLGNLSELEIPAPEEFPVRKDRLWEGTCLECFLGVKDSEGYWEINLSPAGHWNVYRFASYREGMREEEAFVSFPFGIRREPEALDLSLDLDIGKILPAGKALEAGVSAVIKNARGERCHWALAHTGSRPDFHRRDGFTIDLSAE